MAPRPRSLDGSAGPIDLRIARTRMDSAARPGRAITINGTVPGPLPPSAKATRRSCASRTGSTRTPPSTGTGSSCPPRWTACPGVSFPGIRPGETFEYRFPVQQSGTYWYHSHSGFQEQLGHYGPLDHRPGGARPVSPTIASYVVVLSDWTFENPYRLLARPQEAAATTTTTSGAPSADFFRDVGDRGSGGARRPAGVGRMRMNPTDISDVTGATYTYLMNGLAPEHELDGALRAGRARALRFINAAAASFFDVRIPGLPMTVVQVSGQHVEPVETDEFRIAHRRDLRRHRPAREDRAYTIFAEAMDRSGLRARHAGPARRDGRRRCRRARGGRCSPWSTWAWTTACDGMAGHGGDVCPDAARRRAGEHDGHDMSAMAPAPGAALPGSLPEHGPHGPDGHGPGSAMVPDRSSSRLHEPGVGLGEDGWRVLRYTDLRRPTRAPTSSRPTARSSSTSPATWSASCGGSTA